MGISRRALFGLATGAIASAVTLRLTGNAVASPALVGLKQLNVRTLSFDCTNAGEQLRNATYWVEGNYVPEVLADINHALRDWRANEIHPIERSLLDLLFQLGKSLDTDCRFELTCGYRSPRTNAMLHALDPEVARNSLHMKGQAADITLPGRPLRNLHEAALAMQTGGVGYYPDDNFIHVDVGRVRRWQG
jgi:uncharacterized protein YcbK (DUF882 family)